MPYTDWNYNTPNWTNNTSPPINQQNLIDMGNAIQHTNITQAQLSELDSNSTDTLGNILVKLKNSSGGGGSGGGGLAQAHQQWVPPIYLYELNDLSDFTGLPAGYVSINAEQSVFNYDGVSTGSFCFNLNLYINLPLFNASTDLKFYAFVPKTWKIPNTSLSSGISARVIEGNKTIGVEDINIREIENNNYIDYFNIVQLRFTLFSDGTTTISGLSHIKGIVNSDQGTFTISNPLYSGDPGGGIVKQPPSYEWTVLVGNHNANATIDNYENIMNFYKKDSKNFIATGNFIDILNNNGAVGGYCICLPISMKSELTVSGPDAVGAYTLKGNGYRIIMSMRCAYFDYTNDESLEIVNFDLSKTPYTRELNGVFQISTILTVNFKSQPHRQFGNIICLFKIILD